MILRTIKPLNWGPFINDTYLDVEKDVTVLTAANDAGKSSLLRVLDAAYHLPNMITNGVKESDLNQHYRLGSEHSTWNVDKSFGCRLYLTATSQIEKYIQERTNPKVIRAGDEIRISCNLAPQAFLIDVKVFRDNQPVLDPSFPAKLASMPHLIGMPTGHLVRDIINLKQPNHAERLLLQTAFGGQFNADKIIGFSKPIYHNELAKAQRRFNVAVAQVIPPALGLTFTLQATDSQGELIIQPVDRQYGYAPLGVRGTGVKTLLSLLASLLEANVISEQLLIYIDEPETSLHADAQHLLRSLLEELARRETVQVIYATHSSAMINNMRPRSVRLLKRVQREDYVVTEIDNRPIDNNFVHIRTTLGMSPSDSLQYAPVTVVVEGATEALGIFTLLEKLHSLGVDGFEDLPLIIPQCHIADGVGDSYIKQAKFAVQQNSQVVVFLDGDKNIEQATRDALPFVAFIKISDGKEVEQLLDPDIYFGALSGAIAESNVAIGIDITPQEFDSWLAIQPDKIKNKAFSKQVDAWLDEIAPSFKFVKPRVFLHAIELVTDSKQVHQAELKQLVLEILSRLPSKE